MAGRQIVIDIIGDSKKFTQATDSAIKATVKMESRMDRLKGGIIEGLGLGAGLSAFNVVGKGIGMVTDFLGDASKAASDLNESQSKLDQVFKTQAVVIRRWAADSAHAMGQSTQAAIEATGTFGNFLQAMGAAEKPAADMSMAMVQLAGDLASFNNQDPTEVLDALRSGLSGETEPLRRFGVDVSAARVDAELLASGVKEVGKQFTMAQKIQARYNIIMSQTKTAQGDYARTATGSANAQRTLNAEMENAKAKVGQALNEITGKLTVLAANVIPDFMKAFEWFTSGFDDQPETVQRATDFINRYDLKVLKTTQSLRELQSAQEDAVSPLKLYTAEYDEWLNVNSIFLKDIDKTGQVFDWLSKLNRKMAMQTGVSSDALAVLAERVRAGGGDFDEFIIALQKTIALGVDVKSMAMRYVHSFDAMSMSSDQFTDMYIELGRQLNIGSLKWQDWGRFMVGLVPWIEEHWSELPEWLRNNLSRAHLGLDKNLTDTRTWARTMGDVLGPGNPDGPARATLRTAAVIDHTLKSIPGTMREAMDPYKEAWRKFAEWAKDPFRPAVFADKIEGFVERALEKADEATKRHQDKIARRWRRVAQLMSTPIAVAAANMGQDVEQILATISLARRAIASIPGIPGVPNLFPPLPKDKKKKGRKAAGGPVMAGGSYLVGERGPEVVTMGGNGYVTPNHRLGGGNTYNVNVSVAPGGDLVEAGRQMVRAIQQYERRSGKVWRAA